MLGLGLALALVAVALAIPVLLGVAAGLLLLAAVAPVWVRAGAAGLSVERRIAAPRVEEGEPLAATVRIRAGPVGTGRAELQDPLLGGAARAIRLPPGGWRELELEARFERRGRRALPAPAVVVSDPLGLARRRVAGTVGDEILVLPRVEPVRRMSRGTAGRAAAIVSVPTAAPAATDLEGLRPHRPGTPASRIHWPAYARGHGLHERRLRAEADRGPLVVLDARSEEGEEGAARLDAAVRATVSLARALAADGGCALLLPGERRPRHLDRGLRGWTSVHARLALVEPARAAPRLGAGGGGGIVYVCASPLRRLPRRVAQAAGGGALLVVPEPIAGRRPALAVAGCLGYDLSSRARAPAEAA